MTATAINDIQENATTQPPAVEQHAVAEAITTLLKQLSDINIIEYPESFVQALKMTPPITLDMMQEKWSVYVPINDRTDAHLLYASNKIPFTRDVGVGTYEDEYGIPVTVLTRQFRIIALWYHKGKFLMLSNAAEIDPSQILLINDKIDRPRWRTAITQAGVSESSIIDNVKRRIAQEKALAAYNQKRNELKNSNPAVKRRKASKAAKQARRHNR